MSSPPPEDPARPDTRTRILDATEQIMLDEGYAGVSYRKVMDRAGLKSNLLHHYFKTMDDLFITAFQRREEWHIARLAAAAASPRPLHALWALGVDAASGKIFFEYNALACHRPLVRAYIAQSATRDRNAVTAALETTFARYGIDGHAFPPGIVAMVMAGLARAFATERALGAEQAHPETLAFVTHLLARLEPEI